MPRSTRPRSSQAWTTALLAGLLLAGAAPGPAALAFGWQADTPENQGMCGSTLTAACHRTLASIVAGDKATTALIVIRNDRIVFEWYANGGGQDVGNSLHSANKALFGGTTMAYAVDRCGLVPTAPAGSLIPGWTTPPKSQIQIVHLATHNATLDDPLDTAKHSCSSPLWQTRFWSLCQPPNDPWTIARTLTPTLAGEQPGQYFWYSNPGLALLGYAVTKQCRNAHPDGHDNTLLKIMGGYVMAPIGAPATSWQETFHRTLQDGGPLTVYGTWGTSGWTARTEALVGRLFVRGGLWDHQVVIGRAAALAAVSPTPNTAPVDNVGPLPDMGWGWFTNRNNRVGNDQEGYARLSTGDLAGLPAAWASGKDTQIVAIDPERNLIVVRNGKKYSKDLDGTDKFTHVLQPVRDAFFFPPPACEMVNPAGTTGQLAAGTAVTLQAYAKAYGAGTLTGVDFYYEDSAGVRHQISPSASFVAGQANYNYALAFTVPPYDSTGRLVLSCVAKASYLGASIPSSSVPVMIQAPS